MPPLLAPLQLPVVLLAKETAKPQIAAQITWGERAPYQPDGAPPATSLPNIHNPGALTLSTRALEHLPTTGAM